MCEEPHEVLVGCSSPGAPGDYARISFSSRHSEEPEGGLRRGGGLTQDAPLTEKWYGSAHFVKRLDSALGPRCNALSNGFTGGFPRVLDSDSQPVPKDVLSIEAARSD